MDFVQNFPCFSIILCLFAGILSSGLKDKAAMRVNTCLLGIVTLLSGATLLYTLQTGQSFVYVMGKFPAPWGNEIRAGVLEALTALFFCVIMLLSLLGGRHKLLEEVESGKTYLYYVLTDLLLSSLLALVYTNDMFTAYVFVEINTISACGLIMIRQNGRTIEAAVRYMIMSLLGSGLLLLGLCMLYDLTGHLLMSNMKESVARLAATGQYEIPLIVAIVLISVGICIKSALFPFHAWLPDAYGYSTVSSAAILSSLVSKGYIFLLIKIIYRVIGFDIYGDTRIIDVLFAFGLMGMIFGSLSAIKENDVRRMIAYSSVAQIGYIYMGFGMGTEAGMTASVFHILSHAATKSLLFIAAIGLTDVSGGSRKFIELTGAGYRNKWAGAAFTVGSLSMVGMPLFSGFISKLLFAQAAVQNHVKMLPALIVLGVSTILNAIYFMKTVIRIYTPVGYSAYPSITFVKMRVYAVTLVAFILLNVILGISSQPVVDMIRQGLAMFS
ncbi:MAG: sodium:proton antiporter [Lachnospiraceae bacterium]|jgi:multicomponent Na+:H+ antiporter subunit D|nr:sodium:proton antiporter [Lachnospiraceae bacterium]MCI8985188.1 sodium:proton antiporter [Lachnospiraceae bacterium]